MEKDILDTYQESLKHLDESPIPPERDTELDPELPIPLPVQNAERRSSASLEPERNAEDTVHPAQISDNQPELQQTPVFSDDIPEMNEVQTTNIPENIPEDTELTPVDTELNSEIPEDIPPVPVDVPEDLPEDTIDDSDIIPEGYKPENDSPTYHPEDDPENSMDIPILPDNLPINHSGIKKNTKQSENKPETRMNEFHGDEPDKYSVKLKRIAVIVSVLALVTVGCGTLHIVLYGILDIMWKLLVVAFTAAYGICYFLFSNKGQKAKMQSKVKSMYGQLYGGDLTQQYKLFNHVINTALYTVIVLGIMINYCLAGQWIILVIMSAGVFGWRKLIDTIKLKGKLYLSTIGNAVLSIGIVIYIIKNWSFVFSNVGEVLSLIIIGIGLLFWSKIRKLIKIHKNPIKLANNIFDSMNYLIVKNSALYVISLVILIFNIVLIFCPGLVIDLKSIF